MKTRRFAAFAFALLGALFFNSCDAPTAGTEMYDGDAETKDKTPDDMEKKAEEERKDTTLPH